MVLKKDQELRVYFINDKYVAYLGIAAEPVLRIEGNSFDEAIKSMKEKGYLE